MDSLNYIAKIVPSFQKWENVLEALHMTGFPCESEAFTHMEEFCVKRKNAVHTWYV